MTTANGTNRVAGLTGGAKASPKAKAPKAPKAKAPDHMGRWAVAGVALMAGLSAGLNGYDHSLHAPAAWAGWLLGGAIPGIILILGKVAGLAYKRGQKRLAAATAVAGLGLLLLSVYHCAASIAALTGGSLILAIPMAIAIDLGFVCCEYAALVADQ